MPKLRISYAKTAAPSSYAPDLINVGDVFEWRGKYPSSSPPHNLFMRIYAENDEYRIVSLATGDTWSWNLNADDMSSCVFVPVTATLTVSEVGKY